MSTTDVRTLVEIVIGISLWFGFILPLIEWMAK